MVSVFLCSVLSLQPTRPLALVITDQTSRAAALRLCALRRPEAAATAHDQQRVQNLRPAGVSSSRFARCAMITCLAANDGSSWSAHSTDAGVTYYFNAADGSSRWELPPGVQLGAAPPAAPPATPPASSPNGGSSSSGQGSAGYGAESPMPGREREYEAYKAQGGADAAGGGGGGGGGAKPLAIDEERQSRSQGIANNFYDVPSDDFRRPHGTRGAAPPPPESVGPGNQVAAGYGAEYRPSAGNGQPPVTSGYGNPSAEQPMPGREREYALYQEEAAQAAAQAEEARQLVESGRLGSVTARVTARHNGLLGR